MSLSEQEVLYEKLMMPYISFIQKAYINKEYSDKEITSLEETWKVINFYRSLMKMVKSLIKSLRYFFRKHYYMLIMIVDLFEHEIRTTYPQLKQYLDTEIDKMEAKFLIIKTTCQK